MGLRECGCRPILCSESVHQRCWDRGADAYSTDCNSAPYCPASGSCRTWPCTGGCNLSGWLALLSNRTRGLLTSWRRGAVAVSIGVGRLEEVAYTGGASCDAPPLRSCADLRAIFAEAPIEPATCSMISSSRVAACYTGRTGRGQHKRGGHGAAMSGAGCAVESGVGGDLGSARERGAHPNG